MNEREQLERAVAAIEAQRGVLGDSVVDAALEAFWEKIESLSGEDAPQTHAAVPAAEMVRHAAVLLAEAAGLDEPAGSQQSAGAAQDRSQTIRQRLEAILRRYGGLIERAGEALMGVFGSPQPNGDDAERAVRAALEMAAETRHLGQPALKIGVDSGPVRLNFHGSARGDSALRKMINLAGRLMNAAPPGEILLSAGAFRAVRGIFDVLTLDPLPAQGETEPVQVYKVRRVRPRTFRQPEEIGRASAMIGREAELSQLLHAYETAVSARRMQTVTLVGEPGVGKSRLQQEFLSRLDEQGQPFILFRGRADPGLNNLPHALLRDLLSYRFKILESDTPSAAREKLVHGVEEWLGVEVVEVAHWIGHLAGHDFSRSPYLADQLDDPRRARRQAFQYLQRFLSAVAAHTPVVILVDDLQWADDSSLDGLEALVQSEPRGPILLVSMARPGLYERRPNWGKSWPAHTQIDLPPLTCQETTALAGLTLRAVMGYDSSRRPTGALATLPTRLIERLVETSQGSPFFIEELVHNLFDLGVLVPVQEGEGAGSWRVDLQRLATANLPASLPEAFQARLDHLPRGERLALTHAAVIGHVFWEGALRFLLEADAEAERQTAPAAGESGQAAAAGLPQALRSLLQRGLLFQREVSRFEFTDEYVFRSGLLRGLVYDSIPAEDRRKYHALAAEWLAAASGDRRETYAPAIALHWELAGRFAESAEWYGRAAQHARRISAPEAAIRYYSRAIDLMPSAPEFFDRRVQMYKGLWDMQWWLGRYSAALAAGQALLAEAEERGDPAAQATAWNRIAAIQNRQGDAQAALHNVQRAERLARAAGHAHEVVLALFNRGLTLFRMGNSAAALEAGERALAFNQALLVQGEDSENTREAAAKESVRILSLLGMIHQRAGRFSLADEDFRQALEICRQWDDRLGMITAFNNLGVNAHRRGDYALAAGFYREALRLAEDLEYSDLELACLNNLAGVQVELGEYAQAETLLRRLLERTAGSDWFLLAEVYRFLAQSALGQGRYDEALQFGLTALDLANRSKSSERVGRAWRVLGQVAARGGSLPGARPVSVDGQIRDAHSCFAASLQSFVELGNAGEQARTAREWAAYELEHGDPREGERLWQEARDLFARLGMAVEVERMDRHPIARDMIPASD